MHGRNPPPTPTAPEMVGTTGQATKFGPNLAKSEMEKTKPSWRWGKEKTSPGSIPFPAQRSQLPGQSLEGSPRKGDPPGVGDDSALPGLQGPWFSRDPDPDPRPRPSLRDVLVEVGEEQLASAGLTALTRQVHGGRAARGPGQGLARGWGRPG